MKAWRSSLALAVVAVVILTLLPIAFSQGVDVSYYGYVLGLQLNVTSAPKLLEVPLCSAPYSYAAYEEGYGDLYAKYMNGTLQVSVLDPGVVNVSVYGPPCSVSGALATYWIYLPARAYVYVANGSVLVYYSGANATLINASELEAGPGNLTVDVTVEPVTTKTSSVTTTSTTTTSTSTTPVTTTTSTATTSTTTTPTTSTTSASTTPPTTTVTRHPSSAAYVYAAAAVVIVVIIVAVALALRRSRA